MFAVGFQGTILHYDGSAWSAQSSGTTETLWGVWGTSPTDVYAVGYSGILHFDGTSWSRPSGVRPSRLFGVWGESARAVFAVGQTLNTAAMILRYDGTSWSGDSLPVGPALFGVWGSSSTNVIAVGVGTGVWRYNGSRWTKEYDGDLLVPLMGVWGNSTNDAFVVGWQMDCCGGGTSVVLRYAGGRWARMTNVALPDLALADIWGASSSDVFAVGCCWGPVASDSPRPVAILHFDGRRWSRELIDEVGGLTGVWGVGNDVFAVGRNGLIVHGSR